MDDKMPKCDFEAAMRWARTRLEFGSPSGPNETERDDNLARCYLARSAQAPGMEAIPRKPTEAMLIAARDWSGPKFGKPIGNDAATGCWQIMWDAALQAAERGEDMSIVVREWRMDALHDLYALGDPKEIIGRVDAMNEHNAAIRHLRTQLNLARAALAQDRK